MAKNDAPESTETRLRQIENDLKYWRDEVLIMDYQEEPMRWLISEVRRLNARVNKPRAYLAAPERVKEAHARDTAQKIVIESSKAAGYADSTWLDGNFKHELTNRITAVLLPVQPAPIDFSCRVCGVQCAIAPDPPARAVCPEHCEDHDYEYQRSERGTYCNHCGQQAPEDWYDD